MPIKFITIRDTIDFKPINEIDNTFTKIKATIL
jgi:hypothetical protein